ncbi:TniQ family protein [Microbacterium murale]|uniref:TniQ domain-containing protein n=1 Tax=Microbacterium murale TaxID=1081040 RepID=A0ABQ1S2N4_9MICO|nr:hypothetical protein GCM10007269_33790 [Microbacterium murale]
MRTLPIYVEPVPAETISGYIGRLAESHCLEVGEIRRALIREAGRSTWSDSDPRVAVALARLCGLPDDALEVSFEEHGMWTRCGHPRWVPQKCWRCRTLAEPHAACAECAGGFTTTTRARTGPLCLMHSRWTLRGLAVKLPAGTYMSQAERNLRGPLWERGIAIHTGEFNLAAAAILAWAQGNDGGTFLEERAQRFGLAGPASFEEVMLCGYPEVVRIVEVAMSPRILRGVLQVSRSALPQIDGFANVIANTLGATVNDSLHDWAGAVIGHAHRAVLYAAGLRRTKSAKNALCPQDRALIVASGTKRACLLRHVSPRILDGLRRGHTEGTSRLSVTRRFPLEPDELALQ